MIHLFVVVSMLLYASGCETNQPALGDQGLANSITQQLSNQENVTGGLHPFKLIDNPVFAPVNEMDHLNDSDLAFVTKAVGHIQVFPHRHMHVEAVNEAVNGIWVSITYCPITRSGIGWNRVVGHDTLLLTASGYLFKDNMMPLDVNSGNIWSQMLLQRFQGAVNQEEIFAFREVSTYPLIETTWKTVMEKFPEADVYMDSRSMKSAEGNPLGQELGIIGKDVVEIFTPDMFPGEINLHTTSVSPWGKTVAAGSAQYNYMVAFRSSYTMEPVEDQFPVIMKDETGTLWNIFGEGVGGEHHGEQLESPLYFTAADWAWRDLYENVSYYQPE